VKNHHETSLIASIVALSLICALWLYPMTTNARTVPSPDDAAFVRVLNYVSTTGILETEQGRFRVTEETRLMSLSGTSDAGTLRIGSSVAILDTVDKEPGEAPVVLLLWVDDRR
jgi:hypothetical protein